MNTVKSVYYGWATLIVAGGGAYYFAKKSINADRAAKAEADHARRMRQYELEQQQFANQQDLKRPSNLPRGPVNAQQTLVSAASTTPASETTSAAVGKAREEERLRREGGGDNGGGMGGPSEEASQDPAPTRHAPEDEAQRAREKSKYEAAEVYRSRRGDRFS